MTKYTFAEAESGTLAEVSTDGTYPVTLITPGLGSSAFYSESVIANDAPKAFPKGTHVYLNHAKDGPSPDKLLGTLIADTTIAEDGSAKNVFKPLKHWADFVDQVHKHTGLSINARGDGHREVMEGREVTVADTIDYHRSNSVDLVSFAGREGSGFSESLFQEALAAVEDPNVQPESSASGKEKKDNKMELTEAAWNALTTKVDGIVTLLESATVAPKAPTDDEKAADRAAAVAATRLVESAEVPASVKTRLIESINSGNYAVEDEIKSVTALREELKTELKESGYTVGAAGASGAGAEAPKINGWSV